jgi:hypothetical protein
MTVHINFVCDSEGCKNESGYKTSQSFLFDELNETWGDMLNAAEAAGWQLQLSNARVVQSVCPNHKKKQWLSKF